MKRLAAVALLALATAGCAVPGQELDPGVAFSYDHNVVTQSQVDTIYQAWVNDTEGKDAANRRQVMTLEAIHDSVVATATPILKENGLDLNPETLLSLSEQWLRLKGLSGEPSAEVQRQMESAYALFVIAATSTDGSEVEKIADAAEAGVIGSPRAGTFDAETFIASVFAAFTSAQNQDLQQFAYTEFQSVNGFIEPPTTVRVKVPVPATGG